MQHDRTVFSLFPSLDPFAPKHAAAKLRPATLAAPRPRHARCHPVPVPAAHWPARLALPWLCTDRPGRASATPPCIIRACFLLLSQVLCLAVAVRSPDPCRFPPQRWIHVPVMLWFCYGIWAVCVVRHGSSIFPMFWILTGPGLLFAAFTCLLITSPEDFITISCTVLLVYCLFKCFFGGTYVFGHNAQTDGN
jgi:hypothetical protein